MSYSKVNLTNGFAVKTAPVGFSWTTLFFGFFVPLLRGDWMWAAIILVANIFSYGLASIVFAFVYNKIYMKSLFSKGFYIHNMEPNITEDVVKNYVGYLNLPSKP